jgi:hypothetical protein
MKNAGMEVAVTNTKLVLPLMPVVHGKNVDAARQIDGPESSPWVLVCTKKNLFEFQCPRPNQFSTNP